MSLIKNTLWNLSGYIIPSLIAIPALGILARVLGPERFGLFTLAVALVGYASIFDAGLTRAVIREISYHRHDDIERKRIIANSTIILCGLGFFGGGLIYFYASNIVSLLNVDKIFILEAVKAVTLISFSIPLFLLNQVWLGILEGQEKFKQINLIKTFNSSFIAGLPALFILIHGTLVYSVLGLVVARLLSLIITFWACKSYILGSGLSINKNTAYRLLKYGGWITVSNVISPLMAYFDRFIISNIVGASHVAYYTAPSEGVQRLSIFPGALSRAVFPKLSRAIGNEQKNEQRRLAFILMISVTLPMCLFGAFLSEQIMTIWMGEEFSGLSSDILKILLFGFFFNCIAQIPFADIQAAGKSKVTAIIHLCEVLPYLGILFYCIDKFGLMGAAIAWALRTTIDCIILLICNKYIKA